MENVLFLLLIKRGFGDSEWPLVCVGPSWSLRETKFYRVRCESIPDSRERGSLPTRNTILCDFTWHVSGCPWLSIPHVHWASTCPFLWDLFGHSFFFVLWAQICHTCASQVHGRCYCFLLPVMLILGMLVSDVASLTASSHTPAFFPLKLHIFDLSLFCPFSLLDFHFIFSSALSSSPGS